jgi:hypothetical protein
MNTEERCDIACLNIDLEKQAHKLYETLGFTSWSGLCPSNDSRSSTVQTFSQRHAIPARGHREAQKAALRQARANHYYGEDSQK